MKRRLIRSTLHWTTTLVLPVLFAFSSSLAGENRLRLLPQLTAGQVLRYDIRGLVQKHTKTESRVVRNVVPQDVKQQFIGILQITVKNVGSENGKPVVSALAEFKYPQYKNAATEDSANALKHSAEFTIGSNGQLKLANGLEEFSPIEALAFSSWISKFAFGWVIPERIAKPGEVWKSEEPETIPGPIARLVWERTTTFGENGKCPVSGSENCAVFLTTAVLKQKSSADNSTPEDYKLHDLKTRGTAQGENETYSSISEVSGLLMRGTEDVHQSMEVVIAKTDGTNDVKYTVDATSHFEMLLIAGAAP
ncbi:MAG TPA: hypothetical protein VKH45_15335 [Candidatus Acidoferrum sp.]|nr:hypothetical protein [Candidatus Acidoferrum sp.]